MFQSRIASKQTGMTGSRVCIGIGIGIASLFLSLPLVVGGIGCSVCWLVG